MDSIRIFISYSTRDKEAVGALKQHLELFGFEVFIAHDDIGAGLEWQDEIITHLERSDVFVPVLTGRFHDSEWTDQEVGMALALNKLIIPVKISVTPYGFMGRFQALKSGAYPQQIASGIVDTIMSSDSFKNSMRVFFIKRLHESLSFQEAKVRSRLLSQFSGFTREDIALLYHAVNDNSQVRECFAAQGILKNIFSKYKRFMPVEAYNKVIGLLTNSDDQ